MVSDVAFESIAQAADILRGVAHVTPVISNRQLDAVAQASVFLKCEQFQKTGSFKFRGAYHAASHVLSSGRSKTVATISSGNHGQGLALAAKLLGLSAHVIVPKPESALKLAAISSYGAQLHLEENRSLAETTIREMTEQGEIIPIHAFNDPHVIAGQGTIMLELFSQVPDLDIILAPIGGGGLLSGLCLATHHLNPSLRVYACEPYGAADAKESLRLNQVIPMPAPQTLADGLRTSLGSKTLPILRQHLTDVLLVSEEEIVAAMRFVSERMKLVIEPSSAVAIAPLLRAESVLRGKRVGVVITGGNVDLEIFWKSLKPAAGQP
ncbi:MAG: pyridoxal-phosphate dependent enzyme [Nitrospira sp.]|jgi:threonine dehydratase|nr:pyridoxal-phosphate dependent enzyme [Nitrospira sp.]